jgi:hypothetical protein
VQSPRRWPFGIIVFINGVSRFRFVLAALMSSTISSRQSTNLKASAFLAPIARRDLRTAPIRRAQLRILFSSRFSLLMIRSFLRRRSRFQRDLFDFHGDARHSVGSQSLMRPKPIVLHRDRQVAPVLAGFGLTRQSTVVPFARSVETFTSRTSLPFFVRLEARPCDLEATTDIRLKSTISLVHVQKMRLFVKPVSATH